MVGDLLPEDPRGHSSLFRGCLASAGLLGFVVLVGVVAWWWSR